MIDGLKPYQAMKDSGVRWLGNVPEHWNVRKLKYAVTFSGGGTPTKAESSYWHGTIPWISPKDMRSARITDAADHITEAAVAASATSLVKPGAVLIVVRSGILRRTIPVAINAVEVALNQDMKAMRPRRDVVQSEYLRFLIQGNEKSLLAEWTKQGATVESIEHEFLAGSRIPLPPVAEQAVIVRFLEHADRRIRRYIGAKQKLIKLLEEQKQAIIQRAVTRGLDPNVRLKPSGVDWLGDVPEHWEIWQIGHFAVVGNGSTPSRSNPAYWTSGTYPWLNSGSVNAGTITTSNQFVTEVALHQCHLPRVPSGSVLVAITGQGKTRGKAAVLRIEATINQHIAFITPRKPGEIVTAEYLQKVFVAAYLELRRMSDDSGSTKGALTCEDLRRFRIALPPIADQREITRSIDEETAEVDRTMRVAQSEIDLLREYRTRLIADVVTGKLDVREAAARLPDEFEEATSLDDIETEGEADEAGADDVEEVPEEADA